jgi:hypothetical protein
LLLVGRGLSNIGGPAKYVEAIRRYVSGRRKPTKAETEPAEPEQFIDEDLYEGVVVL